MKIIYEAFGLGEVAKKGSVDVCVTMDGTNLTKYLNFVIAGLKMVDPRAVNPLTGEKELCPLFSKALPQSRKWCFPMKFVMGQESADMYEEHFNEMFEMFYKASLEGQDIFSGWKPVTYSNPCDMAAQQKSIGLGGAAKVKNRFCHACALHSKNIAKPNEVMCVDCLPFFEKDGNWKCYCQPFASSEQTEKYRKALDDLVAQHQVDIEDIKKNGCLKYTLSKQERNSIYYEPETMNECQTFSKKIVNEMRIRKRTTMRKTMNQMRAEISECLKIEEEMTELVDHIGSNDERKNVMVKIMAYIPCIMHCETRVCIKVLTLLLIEGLSSAQGGRLDGEEYLNCTDKEREAIFLSKVEHIINTRILGTDDTPSQWSVPTVKHKGESTSIGIINMENYKMRHIINSIDDLIDISIKDPNRRSRWKYSVKHYHHAMIIMRKKGGDYTKEELKSYDSHAKFFFQSWVGLHGAIGVTNYIHMIGSGHMLKYMEMWGNLNKYSQQGWEALNALIKLFFFRRTNKGGFNSADSDISNLNNRSKLIPIGRLIQRRLIWICNLLNDGNMAEILSKYNVNKRENNSLFPYGKDTNIHDDEDNDFEDLVLGV